MLEPAAGGRALIPRFYVCKGLASRVLGAGRLAEFRVCRWQVKAGVVQTEAVLIELQRTEIDGSIP